MWGKYRRGQHLSIAVPPEVKSQLIHRKALGQGGIGAQIVEALQQHGAGRHRPGRHPTPPGACPEYPCGPAPTNHPRRWPATRRKGPSVTWLYGEGSPA